MGWITEQSVDPVLLRALAEVPGEARPLARGEHLSLRCSRRQALPLESNIFKCISILQKYYTFIYKYAIIRLIN